MAFYTDCDTILKIHYDYYLEGAFSEDHEAKSLKFDSFLKICIANLDKKQDGYFRAIQYTLTTDGHLKSIGKLDDLLRKTHFVTPKGYTFVINGGYKKQVKQINRKNIFETVAIFSAVMGWVVALFLGYLQNKSSIDNNQKDISIVKLSNVISSMAKEIKRGDRDSKKAMSKPPPLLNPKIKNSNHKKHQNYQ